MATSMYPSASGCRFGHGVVCIVHRVKICQFIVMLTKLLGVAIQNLPVPDKTMLAL